MTPITPTQKFHNLSEHATWNFNHKIPKHANKQYISNKTDIMNHNKEWEINIRIIPKEAYRNSFMYMGGKLWNDLPEFVQNSANIESFKRNYKMSKLLMNYWLIQQFLRLFLRLVRFCVMKWLFLTFWAVRSIPWCGWIFVSHIAYTILNYVSVSSNLALRF